MSSFMSIGSNISSNLRYLGAFNCHVPSVLPRWPHQHRNVLRSCGSSQYIFSQKLHTSSRRLYQDKYDLTEDEDDDEYRQRSRRGPMRGRYGGGQSWNNRRQNFDNSSFRPRHNQKFSDSFSEDTKPINLEDLPPLKKDFLNLNPELMDQPKEHHQDFLRQHKIIISGQDIPPPIQKFQDHEFPEGIMKSLAQFDAPTPIQAQGWSIALKGLDMVGIGQTGSGKTLGYLLPGLLHVSHHQQLYAQHQKLQRDAPIGLVLAPTRELVQQILAVASEFGPKVHVESVAMFGGASRDVQLGTFYKRSAKLVVATPGRLIDFLESGQLRLGQCSFVVLDEADRMLDMGFEPQISSIMQHTRSDRQTLMWSATWPSEVQQLASSFLSDAVQLTVGSTELKANPDIVQHVHVVEFLEKTALLKKLLREGLTQNPEGKALVFAQSQRDVGKIVQRLRDGSFQCGFIHGGLDQLAPPDIPDLSCVINHDMPDTVATYVHRVGRTGRCGRPGVAHTFFSQRNISKSVALVHLLQEAGQRVDPKLLYMAAKRRFTPYGDSEVFLPFVPEKTGVFLPFVPEKTGVFLPLSLIHI
ncbi:DEAD-box ATP-dependent RNA helicase 20 [Hyalella azteca]|uniref:RNA helicase n=1 Tax=Hyalella azteca TaxID=294128 RepID=A0A8B7NRS2_HYAAZ|nr:DEAD-box ATP-dependent RNA helicase 20 [Hyalella azteca]